MLDARWLARFDAAVEAAVTDLLRLAECLPDTDAPPMTPAATDWPPADLGRVRALLGQLTTQLADADMAATDTFDELRSACGAAPTELLAPLAGAMADLDFHAARRHVREVLEAVAR